MEGSVGLSLSLLDGLPAANCLPPTLLPTYDSPLNMSSATAPAAFNRNDFHSWLNQQGEPAWLVEARRQAWEQFEAGKWPDRAQEDWMRSDLRPFKLDRYALPGASGASTTASAASQWLSEGVELAGSVETFDGVTTRTQLDDALRAKGVVLGDLSQLAAEHESIIRPALYSVVDSQQDRFALLSAAAWSGRPVALRSARRVDQPADLYRSWQ